MAKIKFRESLQDRKARAKSILRGLKRLYPDADCALNHGGALELMVTTILSAQSTDETVNRVAPGLFERFPAAADFAEAELSELESIVQPTGFFRQKSKNIQQA